MVSASVFGIPRLLCAKISTTTKMIISGPAPTNASNSQVLFSSMSRHKQHNQCTCAMFQQRKEEDEAKHKAAEAEATR